MNKYRDYPKSNQNVTKFIANGKIDWDNELFRIMPRIINSTSKKERNKHLLSWVKKYDNIAKTERDRYNDIVKIILNIHKNVDRIYSLMKIFWI